MLGRVAACAAVLFVWPICTRTSDGDGALPLAEIVMVANQAQTIADGRHDAEAEKQPQLPQESAALAAPGALVRAAEPSAPIAFHNASAVETEPFGLDAEPVMDGEILAKWDGVESQIEEENQVLARCGDGNSWCPWAARRFLSIVNDGQARNGRARVGVINRGINLSIVPTTDLVQWGVADHWSTPLETFTTQRGDCEDYAIAKYVALRAAGVPQQDVRLIVVREDAERENHAVVAVRLAGEWLILDNRWLALVRDREMSRATPLYELDGNGVRRFVDPAPLAKLQQARSGSAEWRSGS
jgi:predicted transglutaminase-like cysteine proteinase